MNNISRVTLTLSHSYYKKIFFLAYNVQLIAQSFWYLIFFKHQSFLLSLVIKIVQFLFMIVSIKSVTKKKNFIRLLLGIHLAWIIYEIYLNIHFWSLNKKLYKR
ncbi:tryptophan-rich sensory protein [Staphylococcus succinus]|uniref:tryptophan-rich sensory protein n=1 Tax=Staphylococcus succinus TaxID=61015 RepID=UPI0015FD2ABB